MRIRGHSVHAASSAQSLQQLPTSESWEKPSKSASEVMGGVRGCRRGGESRVARAGVSSFQEGLDQRRSDDS